MANITFKEIKKATRKEFQDGLYHTRESKLIDLIKRISSLRNLDSRTSAQERELDLLIQVKTQVESFFDNYTRTYTAKYSTTVNNNKDVTGFTFDSIYSKNSHNCWVDAKKHLESKGIKTSSISICERIN